MPAQGTGTNKEEILIVRTGSGTQEESTGGSSELANNVNNSNITMIRTSSGVVLPQTSTAGCTEMTTFQSIQAEIAKLQEAGLVSKNETIIIQAPAGVVDSLKNSSQSITVNTTTAGTNTKAGGGQMQVSVVEVPVNDEKPVLKRQLPISSATSPVVTKVIITKNPNTNQPQPVPVEMSQLQGQTISLSSMSGGMNTIQTMKPQTKTYTISSQGTLSPVKTVLGGLPGTPTKLTIPVSRLPVSPSRTQTKITMIPVSVAKSPQRIIAVSSGSSLVARTITDMSNTQTTSTATLSKPATITMSPSKVIIKHGNGQKATVLAQVKNPPAIAPAQPAIRPLTFGSGIQQIQVPGSKFHYVRLVSPTSTSNTVQKPMSSIAQVVHTSRPIAPASISTSTQSSSSQVKITLPIQATQMVTPKSVLSGQNVQRILLPNTTPIRPATTTVQIRPASTQNVQGLPPGTAILSNTGNIPGLQGFALVPANYVAQIQQQLGKSSQQQVTQQSNQATTQQQQQQQQQQQRDYIQIASSDPNITANTISRNSVNGTTLEATGARPRKPCNCTKSQCLKLYCDCFANGEFCHNCNCTSCANNLEHEEERSRAIKSCLDRNPMAFHPKIGKLGRGSAKDAGRRHNKGCNCKRSGCLKNYCECYEAKIMCSNICKCIGCKNFEESPERKTLMHLADAAEVRVQQQTAAKTKLSTQMSGLPSKPPLSSGSGERLPFTLITTEVAEATCACLLAQAEEAERLKMPPVVQERMVIEEFGRCLMQIIESANKTKIGDPVL
ncbi:protein lin-54 homolog [Gigantopelta aegis]|uniref:protein lin-54 homolog n=1 Tax=Gigantopelta aegis TaxID=1735272 RepID=UPI001B88CE16|nr:protein lin-54 homolog [Gigantopelta aegis]